MTYPLHVVRLIDPADETIGYFKYSPEMRAARDAWYPVQTRTVSTYLGLAHLEPVDIDDGERIDYVVHPVGKGIDGLAETVGQRIVQWLTAGADRVEASRFTVDCWVGPDGQHHGVGSHLVIRLTVKAPVRP